MSEDGDQRELKRFQNLVQLFELFGGRYREKLQPSEELRISYIQLYNLVESYFQDVDRYKQYHFKDPGGSLINEAKRSALTVKWLMRVKPIYVHNSFSISDDNVNSFDYDDYSIIMNELFAIFVAECFLAVSFSDGKFGELLYMLRYRNPDEYALMGIFQVIMDLRKGDAVIAV
jgi:hypothetical protein